MRKSDGNLHFIINKENPAWPPTPTPLVRNLCVHRVSTYVTRMFDTRIRFTFFDGMLPLSFFVQCAWVYLWSKLGGGRSECVKGGASLVQGMFPERGDSREISNSARCSSRSSSACLHPSSRTIRAGSFETRKTDSSYTFQGVFPPHSGIISR